MPVRVSSREKAVTFLKQNPNVEYTAQKIASRLFENDYKWCMQKRDTSTRDLSQDKILIQTIAGEIVASRKRMGKKDNIQVIAIGEKRFAFCYKESINARIVTHAESVPESTTSVSKKQNLSEPDLYPLLKDYLRFRLNVYSKRIDDTRASNLRGKGGNEWLFPDLVGMEILSKDWDDEIKLCVEQYSDKKTKLWSFEVKKHLDRGKVRKYFFQAVSNSSWANFGYLVAAHIDENAKHELQILCSLHGIGFIQLNTEHPKDSQILIYAREKTNIDWNTANRIAETNPDFKDYIKTVREFYQSGNEGKHFWDKE